MEFEDSAACDLRAQQSKTVPGLDRKMLAALHALSTYDVAAVESSEFFVFGAWNQIMTHDRQLSFVRALLTYPKGAM